MSILSLTVVSITRRLLMDRNKLIEELNLYFKEACRKCNRVNFDCCKCSAEHSVDWFMPKLEAEIEAAKVEERERVTKIFETAIKEGRIYNNYESILQALKGKEG
jgi:hypothetical protein